MPFNSGHLLPEQTNSAHGLKQKGCNFPRSQESNAVTGKLHPRCRQGMKPTRDLYPTADGRHAGKHLDGMPGKPQLVFCLESCRHDALCPLKHSASTALSNQIAFLPRHLSRLPNLRSVAELSSAPSPAFLTTLRTGSTIRQWLDDAAEPNANAPCRALKECVGPNPQPEPPTTHVDIATAVPHHPAYYTLPHDLTRRRDACALLTVSSTPKHPAQSKVAFKECKVKRIASS